MSASGPNYPLPRPGGSSAHDRSASSGQQVQGRRAPSTSSIASSSGTGYASTRGSVSTASGGPIGRNASISGGGMAAHLETTVTKLLVATKQLLEGLTDWSQGRITEEEVSDIYVRLGNCFNAAVAAFTKEGISMRDLKEVPALLRTRLEDAINEEASRETLNKHLPRIRPIVLDLLRGLRQKQEQHAAMVASSPTSHTDPTRLGSPAEAMPQYARRPSGQTHHYSSDAVASTSKSPPSDMPISRSREDLSAIQAPDGRISPAPHSAQSASSRPASRNSHITGDSYFSSEPSSGRHTPYEESTRRPSGSLRRPGSLLKSSSSSSSLRPSSRTETPPPPPPPGMALPPLPHQKPREGRGPLPVPGYPQHLQPPREDVSATPPVIRIASQEATQPAPIQQSAYAAAIPVATAFATPPRSTLRPMSSTKKDGDEASLEALKKADPLARRASKRFSAYTFNKISSSTSIAGSPSSTFQTTFPPTPGRVNGIDRDNSARDFVNSGGHVEPSTPDEPPRRKSKSKNSSPRPRHREVSEPPVPALPPLSSLPGFGPRSEDPQATPRRKRVSVVTEETEDEVAADKEVESANNSLTTGSAFPIKADRRDPSSEVLRVDRSNSAVSLASSVSQYSTSGTEQGGASRRASVVPDIPQNIQPKTVFLQLGRDMKKAMLDVSTPPTFASLRMLFTDKFAYNPGLSDFPAIYLRDPKTGVQYELEDIEEVKDSSVLSLNIEPLDQVKQHIDEGLASLARELKDLKVSMGRRMSVAAPSMQPSLQPHLLQSPSQNLSTLSRQGTPDGGPALTTQETAPMKRTLSSTSVKTSENTSNISKELPRSGSPGEPDAARMARLTEELRGSHKEIQNVRREIGVLRQVYLDFRTETAGIIGTLKAQTTHVKEIANTKVAGERAYIDEGKVKLDKRSQDLLTKIEELQDTIDDLKNDVVNRKIKPKPRQMDAIKASISSGQADLDSLSQYIATVKPMWKKTWEAELQNIVDEQQLLNHQEELLADLQADHENVVTVFEQIQQYVSLQSANKIRRPEFRPPSPDQGHQGLKSVMLEVKGLRPTSDKRMKAIEMAEKNRLKEVTDKSDEFAEELSGFVEGKMLKKTGGAEEVERIRQAKSEASLRAMFNQSSAHTPPVPSPKPPATDTQVKGNPGLGLSNSEPVALSSPVTPISPASPPRPLSSPPHNPSESKQDTPPQLQLEVMPSGIEAAGSLEPSPVYSLPEDIAPDDNVQWKLS